MEGDRDHGEVWTLSNLFELVGDCLKTDADAISRQLLKQHVRDIGVLSGQDCFVPLDDPHLGAQSLKGLAKLARDRSATYDKQALRLLGQVEDIFRGEVGH